MFKYFEIHIIIMIPNYTAEVSQIKSTQSSYLDIKSNTSQPLIVPSNGELSRCLRWCNREFLACQAAGIDYWTCVEAVDFCTQDCYRP
jgi:hypothetical protein